MNTPDRWPPALRIPHGPPWEHFRADQPDIESAWRSGSFLQASQALAARHYRNFGHVLGQMLGIGPWTPQARFDPHDLVEQVRDALPDLHPPGAPIDDVSDSFPALNYPSGFTLAPGLIRGTVWDHQVLLFEPYSRPGVVYDAADYINASVNLFRADVLPAEMSRWGGTLASLLVYSRRWAKSAP